MNAKRIETCNCGHIKGHHAYEGSKRCLKCNCGGYYSCEWDSKTGSYVKHTEPRPTQEPGR